MTAVPAFAPSFDVPVRPRLRLVTEADLFRGYATPVVRIEPCACGTNVDQLSGEDETAAVTRHNATPRHAAWSAETRLVP